MFGSEWRVTPLSRNAKADIDSNSIHWYWFKARIDKKKKNILAEKAQVVLYAFLSHFSILQILVCHYNNNNCYSNNKDFISRE